MNNPRTQPAGQNQALKDLNQLKQGMIIGEDIMNQRGNVLITAGFVVEDAPKLVQFLSLHKIKSIKIRQKEPGIPAYTGGTVGSTLAPPVARPVPDPALVQTEEERRLRLRRLQETRNFQNRYYERREVLKSDFQRIIRGEPVTREELEGQVVDILKDVGGIVNVFQLIETIKKDARDHFAHYYHVTLICHSIGKWLDLKPPQMKDLTLSALLHDIGKEQLPPELILRQHHLTPDETLEYQKHVILGYEMVKKHDFITHHIMQAILLHHERIDGSGYPLGIKGDKIPLLARIIAISDVYNSLTLPDGTEKRKNPFEAIRILESEYMDKLDTRMLYIFLHRIGNCFLGQEVKLNDQRIGEVIFIPRINVYRPIIKMIPNNQLIGLSDLQNKNLWIHSFV